MAEAEGRSIGLDPVPCEMEAVACDRDGLVIKSRLFVPEARVGHNFADTKMEDQDPSARKFPDVVFPTPTSSLGFADLMSLRFFNFS